MRTSRTVFFVFILVTLTVAVFARVCAADGGVPEIGIPEAMESPTKHCFDAALSPDGDRILTLRAGVLTLYRIRPLEIEKSLAIEHHVRTDQSAGFCRILVPSNRSTVAIALPKKVLLLDIDTAKVLQQFEHDWEMRFVGAESNGNELVLLGLDSDEGSHLSAEADVFHLFIFDVNRMEKWKSQIPDLGMRFGFAPDRRAYGISLVGGRLYLTTSKSVLVLDGGSYAPELTASFEPSNRYPYSPKTSNDFRKLYIPNVRSLKDYIAGYRENYGEAMMNRVMVIDQSTREVEFKSPEELSKADIDPILANNDHTSRAKHYLMVSKGPLNAHAYLVNRDTGMVSEFNQYDSGEAIVVDKTRTGEIKGVRMTPGAGRYLMMRNREGDVVPMNKATFEKYDLNSEGL